MEEFLGVSYFYYAVSEALLSGDFYHLHQACKNLTNSSYSEYALEVLRAIDSRKLEAELETLPEEVFLEGSYRTLDKSQLFLSYKGMGYELEDDYRPDHLGIELKLLALLCADGNLANQYKLIHLRLDWLKELKERLKSLGALGCLSVIKLLETFLADHKSFLFSQLKENYDEQSQKED